MLTKLSFAEMKEALQQAQELDEEVRDFVRKNAEKPLKQAGRSQAPGRALTQVNWRLLPSWFIITKESPCSPSLD
ncbi:MAG: hypothetical protein R3B95_04640 [Nitrospirales bacterium]|nr:hypothetical protein [Nitrospirales bacterium]